MNIMVIGGSGFLGSRLIDLLGSTGDVSNLDKVVSDENTEMSEIGDITKPDSFSKSLVGKDVVVLLAAEHRDDVHPASRYYDTNVEGTQNVLNAMDEHGVRQIVFTSTVAVYGMNKSRPPSESDPVDPFNHYGQSKLQAEQLIEAWVKRGEHRRALILRPTVIFGEGNRGNVYNLLNQINGGRFLMIGNGRNCKSMAYVGNVVAFIKYKLEQGFNDLEVFNYADKPDLDMNSLVEEVYRFKKSVPSRVRLPYLLGMAAGFCFDGVASLTGKTFPVSSIRVKKFCSTTIFDTSRLENSGFRRPFSLEEGLRLTLKSEF